MTTKTSKKTKKPKPSMNNPAEQGWALLRETLVLLLLVGCVAGVVYLGWR